MIVLPFPSPAARPERWRVVLTKDGHTRLFEILPLGSQWQTWMRHDGHPLRALVTSDAITVQVIRAEYTREIAALVADGWRHA